MGHWDDIFTIQMATRHFLSGMCNMDSPWHTVVVLFLKISTEITWKNFTVEWNIFTGMMIQAFERYGASNAFKHSLVVWLQLCCINTLQRG